MNIITRLIVGAIAGALADYIVKGIDVSFIVKVLVGVVGGYLGGWVFELLNISAGGAIGNILMSLVGAIILLFILRALKHK